VTTQTRPDLAFDACMMSNVGKDRTIRKIVEANKAVKKLKANSGKIQIKYPYLGNPKSIQL